MAYIHNARHLVLSDTGLVLGAFEELDDAVTRAELEAANTEREFPVGYIIHVTEVLEV